MNKIEEQLQRLKPRSLSSEEQENLWQAVHMGLRRQPQAGNAWTIFTWHYKATVSLAALLLVVGGSAGIAWASNDANPGDFLYPVDLAFENVQLTFWPEGQKDTLRVQFADERLREVEGVIGKSEDVIRRGENAQQALSTAVDQLEQAKIILEVRDNQIAAARIGSIIERLSGVTNQHQERLEQLEPIEEDDDAAKLEIKVRRLQAERKFQIKLKSRVQELRSHLKGSKSGGGFATSSIPLLLRSGGGYDKIELEIESEEGDKGSDADNDSDELQDDDAEENMDEEDNNDEDEEEDTDSDNYEAPKIKEVLQDDN